jgi:hypothetical protein
VTVSSALIGLGVMLDYIDKPLFPADYCRLSEGAVMDVAVWLRSLGLEEYEAAFRENAISEKILPRLTAEDLKDLGVSIVGLLIPE